MESHAKTLSGETERGFRHVLARLTLEVLPARAIEKRGSAWADVSKRGLIPLTEAAHGPVVTADRRGWSEELRVTSVAASARRRRDADLT
jgi:hypothetical protein